jgi:hypothetical protein
MRTHARASTVGFLPDLPSRGAQILAACHQLDCGRTPTFASALEKTLINLALMAN